MRLMLIPLLFVGLSGAPALAQDSREDLAIRDSGDKGWRAREEGPRARDRLSRPGDAADRERRDAAPSYEPDRPRERVHPRAVAVPETEPRRDAPVERSRHTDRDWDRGREWDRSRDGDRNRDWDRNRDTDQNWQRERSWNRDWRADRRYNWQRWRDGNRHAYRLPRYRAPYGYDYGYRRFVIGLTLNRLFYDRAYWISDPWAYRLPPTYAPYRWVRYYDDVLLVDLRTGRVIDAIYGFFW